MDIIFFWRYHNNYWAVKIWHLLEVSKVSYQIPWLQDLVWPSSPLFAPNTQINRVSRRRLHLVIRNHSACLVLMLCLPPIQDALSCKRLELVWVRDTRARCKNSQTLPRKGTQRARFAEAANRLRRPCGHRLLRGISLLRLLWPVSLPSWTPGTDSCLGCRHREVSRRKTRCFHGRSAADKYYPWYDRTYR